MTLRTKILDVAAGLLEARLQLDQRRRQRQPQPGDDGGGGQGLDWMQTYDGRPGWAPLLVARAIAPAVRNWSNDSQVLVEPPVIWMPKVGCA